MRLAAKGGGTGEDIGKHVVGLRELEHDRVCVYFGHLSRLAVDHHEGGREWNKLLVTIHILIPEEEVIGGKGVSIAPFHPPSQVQDKRTSVVL